MPWKRTILIVDDEPAVRRAVAALLNEVGYRLFEASHGGEALQVLVQHPGRVDLVLTDVRMPGTDGSQLARILAERWPGIRVLYMSGQPGDVLDGFDLPAAGLPLLEKPFSREELLSRIADALAEGPPDGRESRACSS
jgi:CheY-like chemotaxis protein